MAGASQHAIEAGLGTDTADLASQALISYLRRVQPAPLPLGGAEVIDLAAVRARRLAR